MTDKWKRKKHGYMLALGYENENLYPPLRGDGGALDFFTERGIKWHRHGKSGDIRRGSGPTRNMKSSQVMCVNFLMPLAGVDGALVSALRAIDDDVEGVAPIEHECLASLVEFEWIGVPKSLEGGRTRGANVTNVDAFVIAETKSGDKRAYLMEWKYTEGGNITDYSICSSGDTRRGRYSGLYHAESSSFSYGVSLNSLMYGDFYQLMRNRLLADRMVAKGELGVSDAKVALVIPEGNEAFMRPSYLARRFPGMDETVSDVFRATLKDPDRTFATVSPARLLEAVGRECGEAPAISDWAAYMRKRYGL